jgi:FlgN protein
MHHLPKAAHDALPTVLERELDLLEGLAFRLEMQRLVLRDRNDRWLPRSCREVELAVDQLRWAELIRAVHVSNLARELELDDAPDLRALIAAVAEPWKEIFEDHRRAFLEVTGEVRRLAGRNRSGLAERGRRPVLVAPDAGGCDISDGRNGDGAGRGEHLLLDIVCTIAASSLERVISPSLADFLAG